MSRTISIETATTAPLADDSPEIAAVAKRLDHAAPREIFTWALDRYGDDLLVTTALGAGGVLLLHWLHEIAPKHPAYLIDTGKLFALTHAYHRHLAEKFGYRIETVSPEIGESEIVAAHGERLWERDADLCCHTRKVVPNQKLLSGKRAWLSALRRDQGGLRADLPSLRRDASGLVRVYPLVNWTRAQIDAELERLGIPQHPMRENGFLSVGCWPCTQPAIGPGERTGRWSGTQKTECGLHFPTAPTAPSNPKSR